MVSQERVPLATITSQKLICDELHELPIRQHRDEYFEQGERWLLEEALLSLE